MKKSFIIALAIVAVLLGVAASPLGARYRGGFNAAEDSWIRNGVDIIFYNGSVSSSNETHRLDGAGGVIISAPTAVGTATPALTINQKGLGKVLEVQDGGTAVWSILNGGEVSQTGGQSAGNLVVAAPTGIGTATPAAFINSAGVSNLLEVQDGGVAAVQVYNGGGAAVIAPTAVGTAVPGLTVNQNGVSNIFEARAAATPQFSVAQSGLTSLYGNQLDLDADTDTSITADTDDQVDFEVGGSDVLRVTIMGPVLVEASTTVTASSTITPTSPYMSLTSTAEFTASGTTAISDGTATGQMVCLVNENASDVIHIPDGANTNLSGQADLGNDDVLCVLWDGADWLEISQVDN